MQLLKKRLLLRKLRLSIQLLPKLLRKQNRLKR